MVIHLFPSHFPFRVSYLVKFLSSLPLFTPFPSLCSFFRSFAFLHYFLCFSCFCFLFPFSFRGSRTDFSYAYIFHPCFISFLSFICFLSFFIFLSLLSSPSNLFPPCHLPCLCSVDSLFLLFYRLFSHISFSKSI